MTRGDQFDKPHQPDGPDTPDEPDQPDRRLATFSQHRDRLRAVAYRMTGSISDADDVCQEAWLRWSGVDLQEVREPEAYLVRTVTRLCLDRLGSAAHRREQYVGPWLPEPMIGDEPGAAAELADSLTFAFLVLLDQLTPNERAALLLHDVFGYGFDDVASTLGQSATNARQLASRARRTLDAAREEAVRPDPVVTAEVIVGFLTAMAAGDIPGVMAHLSADVIQLDDGGPKRRAARRPIVGPDRVARFWVNLSKRIQPDWTVQMTTVNGGPGLIVDSDAGPVMVVTAGLGPDGLIQRIHAQLNPDKLTHVR